MKLFKNNLNNIILILTIGLIVSIVGCEDSKGSGSNLSSDATLTSTIGIVSTGGTGNETITAIPYGTTLGQLEAGITPAVGAIFDTYESDGTTTVSDLATGYQIIVTAENRQDQVIYTIHINPSWLSSDSTLTSTIGIVSTGGTSNETITSIPNATALTELEAAITPATGATFDIYESDGTTPAADIASGYMAIVIAEDLISQTIYTLTVDALGASTDSRLTSEIGIVSTGGTSSETITAIPDEIILTELEEAITPAIGATFNIFESDGTTPALDLATGYVVIVTAEDGITQTTYTLTIDVGLSSDARIISTIIGTVSTGATANETLIDITNTTTLAQLEAAITAAPGATFDTYESDGATVATTDLTTGYKIIVTAEDTVTQVTYTLTVLPEIITGAQIVDGTYVGTIPGDTGPTTYIFNSGGSCTRTGPNPLNGTNVTTTGTWSYDSGNVLTIDTDYVVFGLSVQIIETYGAAFTTDSANRLSLINFERNASGYNSIIGSYAGSEFTVDIDATVLFQDYDSIITAVMNANVNEDGTWEGVGSVYTDGTAGDTIELDGTWGPDDNQLVEFGGLYYLPQIEDSIVFIRQ